MGFTQIVNAISAKMGSRTLAVAVFEATCVRAAVSTQIVKFTAHGGKTDNISILATIHLKINIVSIMELVIELFL